MESNQSPSTLSTLSRELVTLARTLEGELIHRAVFEPVERPPNFNAHLDRLPLARQTEITAELELMRDELKSFDSSANTAERKSSDIDQLKRFLEKNRFRLNDSSFFDLIEEGDVMEVYDHRSIQIWRNWAFFKLCPYSLVELFVNDWNKLFARPTSVVEKLMAMMPGLFSERAKTQQYEIPEYLLSAREFPDSNGMLFKMKFVTTIFNHVGQPVAILTTGAVQILPEVRVGREVNFL